MVETAATDAAGIAWRGLRLSATMTEEDMIGLEADFDVLTTGGSPVVKMVLRLRNRRTSPAELYGGLLCFPLAGGAHTATVLESPRGRIKPSPRFTWLTGGGWGAALDPETSRGLALVVPGCNVSLVSFGQGDGNLWLADRIRVRSRGSTELAGYLVVAGSPEEARAWSALGALDGAGSG